MKIFHPFLFCIPALVACGGEEPVAETSDAVRAPTAASSEQASVARTFLWRGFDFSWDHYSQPSMKLGAKIYRQRADATSLSAFTRTELDPGPCPSPGPAFRLCDPLRPWPIDARHTATSGMWTSAVESDRFRFYDGAVSVPEDPDAEGHLRTGRILLNRDAMGMGRSGDCRQFGAVLRGFTLDDDFGHRITDIEVKVAGGVSSTDRDLVGVSYRLGYRAEGTPGSSASPTARVAGRIYFTVVCVRGFSAKDTGQVFSQFHHPAGTNTPLAANVVEAETGSSLAPSLVGFNGFRMSWDDAGNDDGRPMRRLRVRIKNVRFRNAGTQFEFEYLFSNQGVPQWGTSGHFEGYYTGFQALTGSFQERQRYSGGNQKVRGRTYRSLEETY